MHDSDDLFASLRLQFVSDPDDNMGRLVEHAVAYRKNPGAALAGIAQICHNIKGSAQAVGYVSFAELMHEVEDAIGTVARSSSGASEMVRQKIDAPLQGLVDALGEYHAELLAGKQDSDACASKVREQLRALCAAGIEPVGEVAVASDAWEIFADDAAVPAPPAPTTAAPPPASESLGFGFFFDDPPNVTTAAEFRSEPTTPPVSEGLAPQALAEDSAGVAAAPVGAATGPANPAASAGKYLLVEQTRQLFAISLDVVREITPHLQVNPLPEVFPGVRGMIVVRDRALPVLDLGGLFTPSEQVDELCSVICETDGYGFALTVEKPRQVISLDVNDLEPITSKFGEQFDGSLLTGVAQLDGRSVLVVDLRSVAGAS